MNTRPSSRRLRQVGTAVVVAVLGMLLVPQMSSATLQLLKPNPTDPSTFFGRGGYSADALGQATTGGTVQADVPAGSTVVQAYLYGTYYRATLPSLAERTINFDGTLVELATLANSEAGNAGLSTARAEVTAQVSAKVGSGGGTTDFAVNTDPTQLDGVALVVIYSNPGLPEVTVAVLDGGSKPAGDVVTFNFAAPINPAAPGFSAVMSLGSGFSFQGGLPDAHLCGGGQFSTVDINGNRLSSCAGNYDDGFGADGGLITVGGVGDSTDNPNPSGGTGTDDELYNLVPFLTLGDTAMNIQTTNPSTDDNLFLAVIAITAEAAVTTEVCDDEIDNDGDQLVDDADPDCSDDPPPPPPVTTVSVNDVSVTEGDAGLTPATFTVSLSQPAPASGVTVLASAGDGTAVFGSDYQPKTNEMVSFASGESSKPFTVEVIGDLVDEPTETFVVNLSTPTNATIADGAGVGTIFDDERNGRFSCRATGVRLLGAEIGVANGPNTPCRDDRSTTLGAGLGALGVGLNSGTVSVSTDQTPNDLEATSPAVGDRGVANARVEGLRIRLGLTSITADIVGSIATVACGSPSASAPTLVGASRIANLRVNGRPVATGTTPIDITIPLVGILHINSQTIVGGVLTQRAIWLEGRGLLTQNVHVVVAESKVGSTGNPCTV